MAAVAELVAHDVDVVITHGNGPQVGNLLVKNELAAAVVPPVPLDWCGAQTQATLGFVLMDALDAALARRGIERRCATVVTRTLVDPQRPGVQPGRPSRSGGSCRAEEAALLVEHGETWEDRGEKGWRRVVASPEPLEILDAPAVLALVEAGFVVVANGGGGIPVVRVRDGSLRGVEAVIDKDLGAALLGVLGRRRRARDRHRRARTPCCGSAPRRPSRHRPGRASRRCAAYAERGPLRQRLDGAEGRGGLPVRQSTATSRAVITSLDRIVDAVTDVGRPAPSSYPTDGPTTERIGRMPERHRSPQGPDPLRLRRQRARRR